ncbi:MAG: FAD-dependent oxidoreductase, partial [Burkholderiales bacterium]|nr:FAD-dependent oxidoreductase [Burkholderiales bacterium]
FVVRVGDATWHAARVYLNTGTRPVLPPIPGLAEVAPLTNESILDLTEAPRHLVIIGGSYIGLEYAQIFRRLGSEVTVLETSPAIAAREDRDVSDRLAAMFADEGIAVRAGVHIARVARLPDDVVQVTLAGDTPPVTGTAILVAAGRAPNTDGLGLETVGVTLDAQGYALVDDRLATTVPGIWALGDINRRGAFTHTAWQDHEIVLANHTGGDRTAAGRVTTYAMYTDPPLGRIGMTVADARAAMAREGRRFLVATHEMARVSRAKEEGETIGAITVLVDAETERFVGITMLGIGADEIVQVIGAQMAAGARYQVLRDALPVHPTVTEFFPTILGRLAPLV